MLASLLIPGLFLFVAFYRMLATDHTLIKFLSQGSTNKFGRGSKLQAIGKNPFMFFFFLIEATISSLGALVLDTAFLIISESLSNTLKGMIVGRDASMSTFFVFEYCQFLTVEDATKIFEFSNVPVKARELLLEELLKDFKKSDNSQESEYYYRQIKK